MFTSYLPLFTKGIVISGFGRGSKQLGIPTANFGPEVVNNLPNDFKTGVYYGFANVEKGPVYKMVMSVGWNPFYKNEQKSMETHVIHKFDEDFYGKVLRVGIVGYLRPEMNFSSLDELITAIYKDISDAEQYLNEPEYSLYKDNAFFSN